jgi:hypothetical protein
MTEACGLIMPRRFRHRYELLHNNRLRTVRSNCFEPRPLRNVASRVGTEPAVAELDGEDVKRMMKVTRPVVIAYPSDKTQTSLGGLQVA